MESIPITEASKKWCPFAVVPMLIKRNEPEPITLSANRNGDGTPSGGSCCMTDRCMAWRAEDERSGNCGLVV